MTHAATPEKTYALRDAKITLANTTKTPAKIEAIIHEKDELQIIFRAGTGYYRPHVLVNIPYEKKDALLDTYGVKSTHQLHDKNCTLIYDGSQIVGFQMPAIREAKKRPLGIEILLENYDSLKEAQKITATIQTATEVLVEDKYDFRKMRTLFVVWSPNDEQNIGPRIPIKLNREYRTKWSHMFGRPMYHSNTFTQPLTVLIQDDAVVGLTYGTLPVKKEKTNNTYRVEDDAYIDAPLPIPDRSVRGPTITWKGREIEIAPYYVVDLTKTIRGKPQEQLTKLLTASTPVQTIAEGSRELTIFDDKSPLKSLTILGGRVHEITKNPKVDAQLWERQSIDAIVHRNDATRKQKTKKKKN